MNSFVERHNSSFVYAPHVGGMEAGRLKPIITFLISAVDGAKIMYHFHLLPGNAPLHIY
jgi:hypothetical protein